MILTILAWLWSAPQEMLALALMPFYRPIRFEWCAGVLVVTVRRMIGFPTTAGQTLGRIVFLKEDASEWTMFHEFRHVYQSDVLGPLWGPLYGVACVVAWLRGRGAYDGNGFERDANDVADREAMHMGLLAAHDVTKEWSDFEGGGVVEERRQ